MVWFFHSQNGPFCNKHAVLSSTEMSACWSKFPVLGLKFIQNKVTRKLIVNVSTFLAGFYGHAIKYCNHHNVFSLSPRLQVSAVHRQTTGD